MRVIKSHKKNIKGRIQGNAHSMKVMNIQNQLIIISETQNCASALKRRIKKAQENDVNRSIDNEKRQFPRHFIGKQMLITIQKLFNSLEMSVTTFSIS